MCICLQSSLGKLIFIVSFWYVDFSYLEPVLGLKLTSVFSLQNAYHYISYSKSQRALPSQLNSHIILELKRTLVSIESSGSQIFGIY